MDQKIKKTNNRIAEQELREAEMQTRQEIAPRRRRAAPTNNELILFYRRMMRRLRRVRRHLHELLREEQARNFPESDHVLVQ